MNEEIEPILIGDSADIEKDCVENFEYEENDYAIFHLESGYYATQGRCICEEQGLLSEGNIEGEDLECCSCGKTFSIVSGDSTDDSESPSLKVYDISEVDGKLYLNI